MRALEDSGHLHDTDVIIVSDHGQMDLSRVIKPNVFFADAGLIQVDENGNLRDWTAFCCSNAMSAMVYLKDPANVQDYAKTYAVLQKMAAEGIYGFTTVYTKDETKAMGLDGDFSFVLETDGYGSYWIPPAARSLANCPAANLRGWSRSCANPQTAQRSSHCTTRYTERLQRKPMPTTLLLRTA